MGLFDMLSISASALTAERQRAEVTSANLANAETTHTDTGRPLRAQGSRLQRARSSPFRTVLNRVGRFGQPPAVRCNLRKLSTTQRHR